MKHSLKLLLLLSLLVSPFAKADGPWKLSLPGWRYEFPRDHGMHPGFKTEWWYFTGHLTGADGQEFGYQLTFFRQGIRPPGSSSAKSRLIIEDLPFAHFAFTDVAKQTFRFSQRLSRGAFGEAGFDTVAPDGQRRIAWLENWSLEENAEQEFTLQAQHEGVELKLRVRPTKPWVQHGRDGVSQKSEGAGRASHYYSGTRLESEGFVIIEGREIAVKGISWFDHEWATNQLASNQVGWDWFSLVLEDGTELMLFHLRLRDGGVDRYSSGTFVDKDGTTRHLPVSDYQLTPVRYWTSPRTGGKYPIAWKVAIPSLSLSLDVSTPVPSQELVLEPIKYWEGLVHAKGTRDGKGVEGRGYVELTGYASEVVGMSTPAEKSEP